MDYEEENHPDSGTSSSDGLPASDVPTSSTASNNINPFDAFVQVSQKRIFWIRHRKSSLVSIRVRQVA